jgi:hypothetical protein
VELSDPAISKNLPPEVSSNDRFRILIGEGNETLAALSQLNQDVSKKLRDGLQPAGTNVPDKGVGERDKRPGVGRLLNEREKRMMRWTLRFQNRSGEEYVRQLQGLGAILAVPKDRGGNAYWLIRDLNGRPARLLDEDVYSLNRIFWNNTRQDDVEPVMRALGLRIRPSHFVAFMPKELEDKLAEDERRFQGLAEDDILETQFEVRAVGSRYVPVVVEQRRK